jgi:integrase
MAIADVDLQRGMLHVRNGKGGKDRYVPLGTMLVRGIKKYLEAEHPHRWLFEGTNGECLSFFLKHDNWLW